MDAIYFLVRFTPFWAIPTILIAGEFAYIYWLKGRKTVVFICASFSVISAFMIAFYYWYGGPEKSVQKVIQIYRYLLH